MSAVLTDSDRPVHKNMITVSIMLATIIQAIDGTIANVALPHMQGSFNASLDQVNWVLTSFIVAVAVTTPLTGWLCDRFGQKQIFLLSIGGFTIASLLCGVSADLSQMVIARILQGVFGAALVPLSQAVLLDINPPSKHGSAMAIWGVGVMIGPMLGPMLGGWLTDSYSWRWVFLINLPLGLLAFGGIYKFITPKPIKADAHFDMRGFVTLSLAIACLQLLLDRGEENDWFESTETWIEMLVLSLSFLVFILHTATRKVGESFFEFRLVANLNYSMGLILIFVVGLVLFATRSLTPTLLQGLMNYSAQQAGWALAPSGLGTMVAMLIVGRLVGKVDFRYLLVLGFGITAFSLWQMSNYSLEITTEDIMIPGFIQGLGLGIIFVPLSAATFATLTPELRSQGTAVYSLIRNIGSSIGIALVQTMLVRNTQVVHASLAQHIGLDRTNEVSQGLNQGFDLSNALGLPLLNAEITKQATMIAYVDNFWLMFVLTLLILPALILIKPHKPK